MKIGYTSHSRNRLKERGISKQEVEEAIKSGKKANAYDSLRMAMLKNKKGALIVIYNIKGLDKIDIVTAYRQ